MPRTLSTAETRREEVLTAAMQVAAEQGLHAPTSAIAKAAGISHAYLFRLFPTKTDLVSALLERVHDEILATFAAAGAQARIAGDDPIAAMGVAYVELIQRDRGLLTVQLQGHAAAVSDPELQAVMRRGFGRIVESVREQTGADAQQLSSFFATGMLLNVLGAMDALELAEPWAQTLCQATELLD